MHELFGNPVPPQEIINITYYFLLLYFVFLIAKLLYRVKCASVQYREGVDIWLFVTLVLKVFLFVGLITFRTIIEF